MDQELLLRLAIVGLVVAFVPVGAYHRYRAHTAERLRRRDEGLFVMVALRLCGVATWLGLMVGLIDPHLLAWSRVDLPHWLRWAGLPLGILGGVWMIWMFRTLGANLTDTVTVRSGATLVTSGPYRWVRHPFYLGAAILLAAISLLSASAYIAVAGGLTIFLLIVRTRAEEAQLEARFGEAYRAYRSRTGLLLPRLH